MKLIALDDGHGMETAGKRTPDGSMRENEFNRAVVAKLDVHLRRCGFRTLLVAPGDNDVPLKQRTDAANAAKADLYISVHANAFGNGQWNDVSGIETYHFPGSKEGKRLAEIVHKHMVSGTKLPNRGVKTANFHVLRETNMPAVLVECGYMTNKGDAVLLKSDAYRSECAEELARAVCEYYGVPYIEDLPKIQKKVDGYLNGVPVPVESYLINDMTYVPLRWLVEAMGAEVEWDGTYKIKTRG